MNGAIRENARVLFGVLLFFALWEFLGSQTSWGVAMFPAPSRILSQAFADRELYALHGIATIRTSAIGFAIGCSFALLAAFLFCLFPALELAFRGVNIALFAMPAIVIGPLLVLFFNGDWPQTILAALMVYFPAMSATLLGLRQVDPRLADLVAAYGGGEAKLMLHVRLRGALPSLFAGFRVAAPLAVLGAVLGEFGSGTRWGFGAFLLSALPQGNPARLWGVGLAASAIALAGYALFLLPGRRLTTTTSVVTLSAVSPAAIGVSAGGRTKRIVYAAAALALPFLLWWLMVTLTKVSPIIAPGPVQTVMFLFEGKGAAAARHALGLALGQTLPVAALGLFAGLAFAFVLAGLSLVAPALARAMMPVAMVAQNMPLVAVVPLVTLIFGRGVTASVFMAVLVVFFPAYVLLQQGFTTVPRAANDLVSTYGGGRLKTLVFVAVPYSIGHLFAAARLVAPQALLGVMVAEWLLTGVGLGNLLNVSRGGLDYDMIWAGALISILISVAAYEAVGLIERKVVRR
ncbi:ABC transporter permease [Kaistia algarum]|uniref:ABC transporter permease n=1 Tax=Kaistia algarum TaxID=2083279 RepID=UPI000CE81266|nr:ABC transporter permease subunit [Kaistia algarum]MCX5515477.1 ABC transporter permease subunit [Kaistia algarum]PPE78467.1 ABC transporter permease [Kaistia algarum]